ncbi:uncharacterized protein LOC127257842 isoform X1 [Andrographis paniculata]|uniref:uncharacterized protein LOC127257842 isoform X1 n=1 Tax=Andrographis paniculata TaxID=175694 RepID=UPI0021E92A19|nr:uncharacterized protein LOC127257842 isoform X1 [Andrographis paniculata]XP_051140291.1 uncharacterized protein LOC127257842 isoform X1 [Andrographis paniculata]
MVTQDFFGVFNSSCTEHGSEIDDPSVSASDAMKSDSEPPNSQLTDDASEAIADGVIGSMDVDTSADTDYEKKPYGSSIVHSLHVNGSLAAPSKSGPRNREEDGALTSRRELGGMLISGHKRPRIAVDEHRQASVHIIYDFLPRESKQKLEELLLQWSRWHSQYCSSSDDFNATVESGESAYFPALRVCSDEPYDIFFWVDGQTKTQLDKEVTPLDFSSVPLYDRGCSLVLTSADGSSKIDRGVETLHSSRCFNCGSYNHGVKECPKPRDNVAIHDAWEQHKAKKKQHANSSNSIRYYQSSRGGKYDGLAPGCLDADTRRAMGLGALSPPPWLNRMREMGYPPGYLVEEVDDQPSGITIFGDSENENEIEDGKVIDAGKAKPYPKMTVQFPGINAPIPENADERAWESLPLPLQAPLRPCQYRDTSHCLDYKHSSENYWSHRHYAEGNWDRGSAYEVPPPPPPGCDSIPIPSLWRFRFGRSYSDIGRVSPLIHSDFSPPTWDRSPAYDYGYSGLSQQRSLSYNMIVNDFWYGQSR